MTESTVQETVAVPAASASLSQGLSKLLLAIVANHKAAAAAGSGALVEVSTDVTAAVADLGPALASLGLLGGEVQADPLGASEALVLAALESAKVLVGSPSAAPQS